VAHPVLGEASQAAEEEQELRGREVRRPGDGGERERGREEQRVGAAGGGVSEVAVVRRGGGDEGGGERGEVVGVCGELGDEVGVAEDAGVEQRVRGWEHPTQSESEAMPIAAVTGRRGDCDALEEGERGWPMHLVCYSALSRLFYFYIF